VKPKLIGRAVAGNRIVAAEREGEGGARERKTERERRERERARAGEGAGRLWNSSYMRAGADHGFTELLNTVFAGSNCEGSKGEAGVGRKLLQGKGAASVRGAPVVPALWTAGNTPRQVLGMND
jgi:hypothetical protein